MTGLACDSGGSADDGAADTGGTTGEGDGSTGGADTDPITTTLVTSAGTMPGDDEGTGDEGTDGTGSDEGPADDTTDGGGETDGTTGGPALDCDSYCGVYLDACLDYSAYANMEDCLDNCAQWPTGAAEDVAGDSLGCRIYHATVAGSLDPSVHCPHAGPNGGEVCADESAPDCGTYCDTYMSNCTGDNGVYTDMEDCLTQCDPWYQGTDADIDGNTVGCRTYHAGAPAFGDPELHCPHAGPGGGGVCVFAQ